MIQNLFAWMLGSYTVRYVVLGAAVVGATTGVLGALALLRRQSLMGDAMSHAALPGIALMFIVTQLKTPVALFAGALISAWLAALLIIVITRYTRIKEDSALGITLAVFFGFGMVLLSWIRQNMGASQAGLNKYLFGQAAAIIQQDVVVMATIGLAAISLVVLFWKEFKLLIFDPDFAASLGFPVKLLDMLLTSLLVVAIVAGLQMVGVVLMAALIVAPAAAARQWTERLDVMVLLSAMFGALSGIGGTLISSTERGLATGPVIVIVASGVAFVSLLMAPSRGLFWAWMRQQQNRRRLAGRRTLEALYTLGANHASYAHPHAEASLQALLPDQDVHWALRQLAQEGLVFAQDVNVWSLTENGIARVEKSSPLPGRDGNRQEQDQTIHLGKEASS